jgi:hypothetical protein
MKITRRFNHTEIEAALRRDMERRGQEVTSVRLVYTYQFPDRQAGPPDVIISAEVEMKMPESRDSDTLPEPMDEKTRAWAIARAKACPDRSGD